MAYVFVCENWTDDFNVNEDWIFSFSKSKTINESDFKFSLSIEDFETKKAIVKPPKL